MAKLKVPKRVAGVKVPKKVRKQVKKALVLADSPAVRELAVAGLTLAAERLLDRPQSKGSASEPENGPAEPDRRPSRLRRSNLDSLQLGEVLRAAAVEGARRFLDGYEQGRKDAGPASDAPAKGRPGRSNGRSAAAAAD